MTLDLNELVEEAYQRGAIEGYRRGREDAANAIADLSAHMESRWVRIDFLNYEDGQKERPDIWIHAAHATGVARGEY
jgi:flagellar biosynthesis/type III secretory pathway protein FliH